MTKTVQSVSFASLSKSENGLISDKHKAKEDNSIRGALLLKFSRLSIAFVFLAITVISITGVRSLRTTSLKTALIMGKSKLANDMNYFAYRLSNEYGQLCLKDGGLEGREGVSLQYNHKLMDEISADFGVTAAVFVRDGDDYRLISAGIADNAGKRAMDAYLGTGSAAYPSVHSGRNYSGEDFILGKNYLAEYRPVFAADGKEVIGVLFIGKEMTAIENVINGNTVKHIKKTALIAFAVLLASIAAYGLAYKFILLRYINASTGKRGKTAGSGLAERLIVFDKI